MEGEVDDILESVVLLKVDFLVIEWLF